MQYKVPQKIDLEDKIIGPLTLKQFIYLLAGGMIDFIIYSSSQSLLAWTLMVLIGVLALSFAFVQIQEQPFSYLVLSLFSYLFRPKIRLWNKKSEAEKMVELKNKKDEKLTGQVMRSPEEVKSALASMGQVLDTYGWSPEQYKEELSRYGLKSDLEERIKSAPSAKKEFNLGKTEEAEVDLLHKMQQ